MSRLMGSSARPVHKAIVGLILLALLGCPAGTPAIISVTISGGDLELVVGEGETLTALVVTKGVIDDSVSWVSDEPGIVNVEGAGSLSALGEGVARITATSNADPTKSDEISVTVALPGSVRWTRQFGTTDGDFLFAVATDAAGNIIVTGQTLADLAATSAGEGDVFVRKYDPEGNSLWTRQFGTSELDRGLGVAVDGAGNVIVAGVVAGLLEGVHAGDYDVFVRKYDPDGGVIWTRQFGTAGFDLIHGVATDAAGNIIVGGDTTGSFEGAIPGDADVFVRKYDPNGEVLWTRQFGTPFHEEGGGVAIDSSDTVFISGTTYGNLVDLNSGLGDAFVRKYSADGDILWTRQFGTESNEAGFGITADPSDHLLVTGQTAGELEGVNAGNDDLFVRKYDPAGNIVWTRQLGTGALDGGYAVVSDVFGNVLVTGETAGDLSGGNAGGSDTFALKLGPDGEGGWTRQLGTNVMDIGAGVAVNAAGHVIVVGWTAGSLVGESAGAADAFLRVYGR